MSPTTVSKARPFRCVSRRVPSPRNPGHWTLYLPYVCGSQSRSHSSLQHSHEPVEGLITKLKYIKRSLYGRGHFEL